MIKNRNENEINGDFSGTVQFKTGGCYVVVLQSSLNGYTDASVSLKNTFLLVRNYPS